MPWAPGCWTMRGSWGWWAQTCTSWEQLGRPSRPRWSNCKGRWACSMVTSMPSARRLQVALQLNLTLHGWANWRLLQAVGREDCGRLRRGAGELGRLRDGVERCSCPLLPPGALGPALGSGDRAVGRWMASVCSGAAQAQPSRPCRRLSEVILTFSSLNDSLHELQTTVEARSADLADLGATKDRIISEINRLQQRPQSTPRE